MPYSKNILVEIRRVKERGENSTTLCGIVHKIVVMLCDTRSILYHTYLLIYVSVLLMFFSPHVSLFQRVRTIGIDLALASWAAQNE
jgi:hypothetical protein